MDAMQPSFDRMMIVTAMMWWPYLLFLNVGMAMGSHVPMGPGVRATYQ